MALGDWFDERREQLAGWLSPGDEIPEQEVMVAEQAPVADPVEGLIAPNPYTPQYSEKDKVNPRQMLWAGLLQDMGNLFGGWNGANYGGRQLQGTGLQMMNQAKAYNQRMDQANLAGQRQYMNDQNAYVMNQQQLKASDADIAAKQYALANPEGKSATERYMNILMDPNASQQQKLAARAAISRPTLGVDALGNPTSTPGIDTRGWAVGLPGQGGPAMQGQPMQAGPGVPPQQQVPVQQAPQQQMPAQQPPPLIAAPQAQPQQVQPRQSVAGGQLGAFGAPPDPTMRNKTAPQIEYDKFYADTAPAIQQFNAVAKAVSEFDPRDGDPLDFRDGLKKIKGMNAALMLTIKNTEGLGALDAADREVVEDIIGDVGTIDLSRKEGRKKYLERLQAAGEYIERKAKAKLGGYKGYAVEQRQLPDFWYADESFGQGDQTQREDLSPEANAALNELLGR